MPKHNLLLIAGDFNAHLGQDDCFGYSFHETTNRNGNMLTNCQKISGQTWTHTSLNNFKSQIDFIIMNSKWKNSAKSSRAYNSFISLASDHRIVSANIKLILRKNIKKVSKTKLYDWSTLKYDTKIKKHSITEVENRYSALTLQDESKITLLSANSRYENVALACKEISGKVIPLKTIQKKCNPW